MTITVRGIIIFQVVTQRALRYNITKKLQTYFIGSTSSVD